VSSADVPTVEDPGSAAQRERRQRILDATIALASRGGFDAVQMRTVAERADVALGTLYRYFPSKVHLLVSALGREFERAGERLEARPVEGDTAADRVAQVVRTTSQGLEGDPHLTEALTRAFLFADRSVQQEIAVVDGLVTTMLTRAMDPSRRPGTVAASDEDVEIARVIGDVWLSALMGWVTGRSTFEAATARIDRAVRLLLR
jgi:AcrR family transcriptional regulator